MARPVDNRGKSRGITVSLFQIEFTESKDLISVDEVRFSDAVGRVNITAPGDADSVWAWSKTIVSSVTIAGLPVCRLSPAILPKMRSGATVGVKIRTPNGDAYSGTIGIDQYYNSEKGDKAKSTLTGTFSGRKTQDGEKPVDNAKYGTKVDLRDGSAYTIGFQDRRMDSAVRPFYIDGIADNATTIPSAIKAVVKSIGSTEDDLNGFRHGHPADPTLKLLAGSGRRVDNDAVMGALQYGRGPRDCSPAAPSVTVGYEETRVTASFSPFGDVPNPICASVTVTKTIKVQVPTLSIRVPGVWYGPSSPAQPSFTGAVNIGSHSLFGRSYAGLSLRFDGIDFIPHEDQVGIYYTGTMRFVFKPGGWRSFSISCVYPVPLPLEGNQTQHSYINTVVYEQYYKYPPQGFDSLATMCPVCYGESA